MPLSQQEQQELKELRRLEELEKKYGGGAPSSSGITASAPTAADKINQLIYNFKQKASAPVSVGGQSVSFPSPEDVGHGMASAGLGGAKWAGMLKPGLEKSADLAMRSAVGGLGKPGLGNILAKEGLWGTRGRMASQAEQKLPAIEGELQDQIADKMGQSVDSVGIAKALADKAKQYRTSSGYVPASQQGAVAEIEGRAADVASRGLKSPLEALELKRIAGREGYSASGPRSGLSKELARIEGEGYREGLEKIDPGITANLTREEAMMGAKQGLGEEANIGAAIKSLFTGHPVKAAMQASPIGPLVASTAGHAMQKGSQALPNASSTYSLLNYLFNKPKQQSEGP